MKAANILRRRWRCLAVALILAGGCFVYVRHEALLCHAGRWLNVADRLEQPVNTVMVLGGGASIRPFVAAQIIRAELANKILISNVELTDENLDGLAPAEQEVTRQILLRLGVPASAIVLLTAEVGSTEAEAWAAAAYLKLHPGERLAVVTSDYHTRRAQIWFRRTCGRDIANVVFIGVPTDEFDASNWWCSEHGLVSYLTEYLKLARTVAQ